MIGAGLEGDLAAILDRRIGLAAMAITDGVAETAARLRGTLKDRTRAAGLGKLANTWNVRVYPQGRVSLGAAGLVYTKADAIMQVFEKGATIRALGGRKYLCIPTGYNKARGQRKSRSGALVSPQQMAGMRGWTYVRPTSDRRGLVWFLRVTEAATKGRNGRVRRLAFAGGMRLGGRNRGDVGSGRSRRVEPILEAGAVPMFILLPEVHIRKRLDVAKEAELAVAALPGTIAARLQRIAR